MTKQSPLVIIGVIIIVALLMGGTILTGFSDLLGNAWDLWGEFFGDFDLNGANGNAYPKITLHYVDGSTRTFGDESQPLMISDVGGGEVSSIDVDCVATLTYEGTIQSVLGQYYWLVTTRRASVGKPLMIDPGDPGGDENWIATITSGNLIVSTQVISWESGVEQTVKSFTVTASDVANAMSEEPAGDYYIGFEATLEIDIGFVDGAEDSVSEYGAASWHFNWTPTGQSPDGNSHIESLSVGFS